MDNKGKDSNLIFEINNHNFQNENCNFLFENFYNSNDLKLYKKYNKFIKKLFNNSNHRSLKVSDLNNTSIYILDSKKEKLESDFKNHNDEYIYKTLIIDNKSYSLTEDYYILNTYNFIGFLTFKNTDNLNIVLKKEEIPFLNRMLKVMNDIFIDDSSSINNLASELEKNSNNLIIYIIVNSFFAQLKKAISFSLPLINKKKEEESYNIKGKINLKKYFKNNFIKQKNKISYSYNIKEYDEYIIDIIYGALKIIKRMDLSFIKKEEIYKYISIFGEYASNKRADILTFKKAFNSKAFLNPMFEPYKKVLNYSKIIYKINDIDFSSIFNEAEEDKRNNSLSISGYLVYIPSLFENYIYNLLKKYLDNDIYEVFYQHKVECFALDPIFKRNIYLDFLIHNKRNDTYTVLDTKFKKMNYKSIDFDKDDLYQLSFYGNYLNSLYKNKVKQVVLLYPYNKNDEKNYESRILNKDNINNFKYIIETISILENENKRFSIKEKEFIQRIKKYI